MAELRHNGIGASLRRIRLVAGHAFGEALHLRLTLLLVLTGAGLLAASVGLREFNFGAAELKFIGDFGLGVTGFLGTVLAVLVTTQLFFGEIESGAVFCVLVRPVRRGEFVVGKFVGVAALLAIFVATLAVVLGGLIAQRETALQARFVPLPVFLQACALVWFKVSLVAALTLAVCSYAGSALFASVASILLVLIAQVAPLAGGGAGAWLRFWPNLGLFDPDVLLTAGRALAGQVLAGLVIYWVAWVLLLAGIASYVFRHREF